MRVRQNMMYPFRFGSHGEMQPVHLDTGLYDNDRLAIRLTCPDLGEGFEEPWMTCTVNMPDDKCAEDEVWIKDYSENQGCAEWLINEGVIQATPVGFTRSGYVTIYRYRLTEQFVKELEQAKERT